MLCLICDSFVDLSDDLRLNLEVSVDVHETVDLLLNIGDLCVAVAAAVRKLLDGSDDAVEAPDEILFAAYFVAVSPAGILVTECDPAKFADENGLAFVFIAIGKGGHIFVEVKAQILAELVEKVWPKVATGEVKPTIYQVLPITEAEAAHDILYRGKNVGKVVLTVE